MPPLSYLVMEFSIYVFALALAWHAKKEGLRWLASLLWGMAFGLAIELVMVQHGSYSYGRFVLMVGPEGKQVPLWIGIGWGEIVYAASWTAQRLRQPAWLRPATAAVLAVNIDLSLDPIAEMLGYWTWHHAPSVNLYGVPFDNFLGWFLIVSLFSATTRGLFRLAKNYRNPVVEFLIPGIGAALAAGILFFIQDLAEDIYAALGGQLIPFIVVFGLSAFSAFQAVFRTSRDMPPSAAVIAVPVYFHLMLLLVYLFTGGPAREGYASLLVLIPQNLGVGFFAFSWASLDLLFPRRAPVPALAVLPLPSEDAMG